MNISTNQGMKIIEWLEQGKEVTAHYQSDPAQKVARFVRIEARFYRFENGKSNFVTETIPVSAYPEGVTEIENRSTTRALSIDFIFEDDNGKEFSHAGRVFWTDDAEVQPVIEEAESDAAVFVGAVVNVPIYNGVKNFEAVVVGATNTAFTGNRATRLWNLAVYPDNPVYELFTDEEQQDGKPYIFAASSRHHFTVKGDNVVYIKGS